MSVTYICLKHTGNLGFWIGFIELDVGPSYFPAVLFGEAPFKKGVYSNQNSKDEVYRFLMSEAKKRMLEGWLPHPLPERASVTDIPLSESLYDSKEFPCLVAQVSGVTASILDHAKQDMQRLFNELPGLRWTTENKYFPSAQEVFVLGPVSGVNYIEVELSPASSWNSLSSVQQEKIASLGIGFDGRLLPNGSGQLSNRSLDLESDLFFRLLMFALEKNGAGVISYDLYGEPFSIENIAEMNASYSWRDYLSSLVSISEWKHVLAMTGFYGLMPTKQLSHDPQNEINSEVAAFFAM